MIYELFAGSQRTPFAPVETAIRIVFDSHNRCGHIDQFALEVYNAVESFMAAAATARRNSAVAVASLRAVVAFRQRAFRTLVVDFRTAQLHESLGRS